MGNDYRTSSKDYHQIWWATSRAALSKCPHRSWECEVKEWREEEVSVMGCKADASPRVCRTSCLLVIGFLLKFQYLSPWLSALWHSLCRQTVIPSRMLWNVLLGRQQSLLTWIDEGTMYTLIQYIHAVWLLCTMQCWGGCKCLWTADPRNLAVTRVHNGSREIAVSINNSDGSPMFRRCPSQCVASTHLPLFK